MSIEKAILEELNEIKKGFKDAEDMDGYDLANEKFHLLNAIALVKKLTIPVVSQQREQLLAYHNHLDSFNDPSIYNAPENMIDDYLANNCG
jgi:hypothetical protein